MVPLLSIIVISHFEFFSLFLQVQHWNLSRYLNMALDGNWKDDLDVTRVMQAPKVKNFVTQPDIPLESFNPIGKCNFN